MNTPQEAWTLNTLLLQKVGPLMQDFADRFQLTQRESEILILIAINGCTNREIAEICVITEKTVKNHLANMMNKIGIRTMRKLYPMLLQQHFCANETSTLSCRKSGEVPHVQEAAIVSIT